MVRRALVPGLAAAAIAFIVGYTVGGGDVAISATLGIAVVVGNFAANGLSLAWASTVSVTAVQVVALVGFVVRLAIIVGVMFALDATAWFSPVAFGLTVMPATLVLLVFEAMLVHRHRIGTDLNIPADPAAVAASERLAAKEAAR
jgi:hypothetical protein